MQNLNSCFALALFNVSDDRSINSRNVFSFKVAGQIYNQINLATHSSQIPEGNFQQPWYSQMYLLDQIKLLKNALHIL